jgi:PAS domain S-box-containing protein
MEAVEKWLRQRFEGRLPQSDSFIEKIQEISDRLPEYGFDLESFFQRLPLMVVVSSASRFVRVNASACRLLGYSADELTGRDFLEFVHPDDRMRTKQEVERMNKDPAIGYRNRYVRGNGTILELSWYATPWAEGRAIAIAIPADCEECPIRKSLMGE